MHDVRAELYESRCSQDDVNLFRKSLLSLCLSFELHIMNGNVAGDPIGRYTYISRSGNSVNDYLIISADIENV